MRVSLGPSALCPLGPLHEGPYPECVRVIWQGSVCLSCLASTRDGKFLIDSGSTRRRMDCRLLISRRYPASRVCTSSAKPAMARQASQRCVSMGQLVNWPLVNDVQGLEQGLGALAVPLSWEWGGVGRCWVKSVSEVGRWGIQRFVQTVS